MDWFEEQTSAVVVNNKAFAAALISLGFQEILAIESPGPLKHFYGVFKANNQLYSALRDIKNKRIKIETAVLVNNYRDLQLDLDDIAITYHHYVSQAYGHKATTNKRKGS